MVTPTCLREEFQYGNVKIWHQPAVLYNSTIDWSTRVLRNSSSENAGILSAKNTYWAIHLSCRPLGLLKRDPLTFVVFFSNFQYISVREIAKNQKKWCNKQSVQQDPLFKLFNNFKLRQVFKHFLNADNILSGSLLHFWLEIVYKFRF